MRFIPGIGYGTDNYPPKIARRLEVLNAATWMAAAFTAIFGVAECAAAQDRSWIVGVAYLAAALLLAAIPLLNRLGALVAPLAFGLVGYATIFTVCTLVGTDTGMPMQFLVAATIMALMLGNDHPAISAAFAVLAAVLIVALYMTVPGDTGIQPRSHGVVSMVATVGGTTAILFAVVLYAVRQTARAEAEAEREHQRSESLLGNMLPSSVAERLKLRPDGIVVDRYDSASVLFADMAGFTALASETSPESLVECLDRVFGAFDRLATEHGMEKIKTSGDAYLAVSGVPEPRPDHAEAMADFALAMRDMARTLPNSQGQPTAIRIGIASGPVVAGVIGKRKIFYDVWGDTVNVASRMETTGPQGEIQVSARTYQLLKDKFLLERIGTADIKGKGPMDTWLLLERRPPG